MKILIAAKREPNREGRINNGVQTWSLTVGAELERLGHTVTYWGEIMPIPTDEFDLGIISNVRYSYKTMFRCNQVINVCHGITEHEKPVATEINLYVSAETMQYWNIGNERYIMPQPINTDYWSPLDVEKNLQILRVSTKGGLRFLPDLCAKLGYTYKHIKNERSQTVIKKEINRSKLVIASGRALLEATSCNVPVLIGDARAHRGERIAPFNSAHIHSNYSTAQCGKADVAATEVMIKEAMYSKGHRDYMLSNHDVKKLVKDYILCSI